MLGSTDSRFELLTPRGRGGVAVIAVHGEQRWQHVAELLRDAAGAPVVPAPGPRLLTLQLDDQPTDQVLLVDRPDQHRLELHLHGSPAVVAGVEAAVGGFVETRALHSRSRLLETARCRTQLALCLEQAGLDFEAALRAAAPPGGVSDLQALHAMWRRSEVARAQLDPCRVVICGSQNAGKSTLMNRLLFQERVLTGDLPGLTRDPVREVAVLGGYPYELVDTAGEGEVHSDVDRRALDRGRRERVGALRLLVVDGSRIPGQAARALRDARTVVVRSKADLVPAVWPEDFVADLQVSCLDPLNTSEVRTVVGERLRLFRDLPPAGPLGGVAALTDSEMLRLRAQLDELQPPPPTAQEPPMV